MIVDEIKFISKYHVPGEGILKAISFLKNIDFSVIEPDRFNIAGK
ncbi:hypothetical protein LCGC14_2106180 [marine sediment metagenome]|uniref:Uncharacterized protein n=1 Tax=marine sediment metagenome TaxID=412755 RepID=A0A0F9GLN5_9ZZZZ